MPFNYTIDIHMFTKYYLRDFVPIIDFSFILGLLVIDYDPLILAFQPLLLSCI